MSRTPPPISPPRGSIDATDTLHTDALRQSRLYETHIQRVSSSGATPTTATIKQSLLNEMQGQTALAHTLLSRQPQKPLLSHLLTQYIQASMSDYFESTPDQKRTLPTVPTMYFVLDYLHAIWSSTTPSRTVTQSVNVSDVESAVHSLKSLLDSTAVYSCIASTGNDDDAPPSIAIGNHIPLFAIWVTGCGYSDAALNERYLRLLLEPHDSELKRVYHRTSRDIAAAVRRISELQGHEFVKDVARSFRVRGILAPGDPGYNLGIFRKALRCEVAARGMGNLSRHSKLPPTLLRDLSYEPGENGKFFADGCFRGTPLGVMPSRFKPCVMLGNECFVTHESLLADGLYRSIQRALRRRSPQYEKEWERRQTHLSETVFREVFLSREHGPKAYHSVWYQEDSTSDNWIEMDLVIIYDTVLIVVEAKSGIKRMRSPALDIRPQLKGLDGLVHKAYRQCSRFLSYLQSMPTAPLFRRIHGSYHKIGEIRLSNFRAVLPIGLTIEQLGPLATNHRHFLDSSPLLCEHPFLSLSIKDLLLIKRFLSSDGELIHYLRTRQNTPCCRQTFVPDELTCLGGYIRRNAIHIDNSNGLNSTSYEVWEADAAKIKEALWRDAIQTGVLPRQEFPLDLRRILRLLDRQRPRYWLELDNEIRNLSEEDRLRFSHALECWRLSSPRRQLVWCLRTSNGLLLAWAYEFGHGPSPYRVRRDAETACRKVGSKFAYALLLCYSVSGRLRRVNCRILKVPWEVGGSIGTPQ